MDRGPMGIDVLGFRSKEEIVHLPEEVRIVPQSFDIGEYPALTHQIRCHGTSSLCCILAEFAIGQIG